MTNTSRFNLPRLGLVLGLVCLAALSIIGCRKNTPPAPAPTVIATPITHNEQLVYTSSGQLFTTDLSGEKIGKLENTGKNNWFPSMAPDQQTLAYWSDQSGSHELWLYNFKTASATRLTFFNSSENDPAAQNFNIHDAPTWSPNSQEIAFSRMGQIWLIDREGYNLETVVREGNNYSPSWSPDGKLLAYISLQHQSQNLYLRRIKTGEEWAITTFPATHHAGGPSWSPDGKKIAFSLSIYETVDIWIINNDGTDLKRLTKDGASNAPVWSWDGKKIAFSSGRQDPYHWEIWVMNSDGSGQFAVSRNGGFSPTWRNLETAVPNPALPAMATAQPNAVAKATISPVPTSKPTTKPTPIPTVPPAKIKTIPTAVPKATPVPPSSDNAELLEDLEALEEEAPAEKPTPKPMPTKKPTLVPTMEPTPNPTPMPTKAATNPQSSVKSPSAPVQKEEYFDEMGDLTDEPLPEEPPAVKTTPAPSRQPLAKATAEQKNNEEESYAEFEEYADEDAVVLKNENKNGGQTLPGNVITFEPEIQFYFAKDLIKASSLTELDKLAKQIEAYPDSPLIIKAMIKGPKWLPLLRTLARARANSVLRHLIVNENIRQINVTAIAEGDPYPDLSDQVEDLPILLVVIK